MSGAISLVALGVGYLVYITACKEKEGVKILGQVIGIFVMIAAILCLICSSMKCMDKGAGYGCHKSGYGKSHCSMKTAQDRCSIKMASADAASDKTA